MLIIEIMNLYYFVKYYFDFTSIYVQKHLYD